MGIHVLTHYKRKNYGIIIHENSLNTPRPGIWRLPICNSFVNIDIYYIQIWRQPDDTMQGYHITFVVHGTCKQVEIDRICALSTNCLSALCAINSKRRKESNNTMRMLKVGVDINYYYENVTPKELYDLWKAISNAKAREAEVVDNGDKDIRQL